MIFLTILKEEGSHLLVSALAHHMQRRHAIFVLEQGPRTPPVVGCSGQNAMQKASPIVKRPLLC